MRTPSRKRREMMNIPARNGPLEAFIPLLIAAAVTPHRAYRENIIRIIRLKLNIL
jgi:hypothetical protein